MANILALTAGDWHTGSNWEGGVVPTATDVAILNGKVMTLVSGASITCSSIEGGTALESLVSAIKAKTDLLTFGSTGVVTEDTSGSGTDYTSRFDALDVVTEAIKEKTDSIPLEESTALVDADSLLANVTNRVLFNGLPSGTPQDDIDTQPWLVGGTGTINAAAAKFGIGGLRASGGAATDTPTAFIYKSSFSFSPTAFTIDFWVKLNSAVSSGYNSGILQFGTGLNGASGFTVYANSSMFVVRSGNNSIGISPQSMLGWKHIAVQYSGSQLRLFVDGVKSVSTYNPGAVFGSPAQLLVGSGYIDWSKRINTDIDELRITQGVARYVDEPFVTPTDSIAPANVTSFSVITSGTGGSGTDYTTRFNDLDLAVAAIPTLTYTARLNSIDTDLGNLIANNMRNNLVAGVVSSTDFIGLLDDTSAELSGGTPAYQREAVVWSSPFNGIVTNTTDITINVPAGGNVAYIAGYTLVTGGTAQFSYACAEVDAVSQSVYTIPAGTLQMTTTVQ